MERRALKILLVVMLMALLALSAHADIRKLMQAKGYASIPAAVDCGGGCGGEAPTPVSNENQTNPVDTRCTLPAVLPCTL